MVISKLNFSSVFAKAWLNALTPANIISSFKKCGAYPFSREAIPCNNDELDPDFEVTVRDEQEEEAISKDKSFTAEQHMLFNRRYEESYNNYEDVSWLQIYHPDFEPSSFDGLNPPCDSLSHSDEGQQTLILS